MAHDSAVGDEHSEPTGAPADDEIKISPAMVDAGLRAMHASNSDFDDERDIVCFIYSEMKKLE